MAVAISLGDLVAGASKDGMARVWRVADGQLVAVLTGHGNVLTDIEFSPDGTQVVTASKDWTARVWKVETGALLAVLRGHRDAVTSAAFTETGRSVVTASEDGTARVWDVVVQPELAILASLAAPVTDVVATSDGVRAVAGDGRAHVLDPETGVELSSETADPRSSTIVGPDGATATTEATLSPSARIGAGRSSRVIAAPSRRVPSRRTERSS